MRHADNSLQVIKTVNKSHARARTLDIIDCLQIQDSFNLQKAKIGYITQKLLLFV